MTTLYDFFTSDSYWFRRPFHESRGYQTIEKDGKLLVVMNALGVNKEDVNIDVDATDNPNIQLLKVSASTKNESLDKLFQFSTSFYVKSLREVEWFLENGLLTVELTFNEPVKPSVKVISK